MQRGGDAHRKIPVRERTIIEAAHRHLADPAATIAAGAALARGLRGGMIVTLSGELGAGKTTLVRGMLRALGWQGPVKSPSYALVEQYEFSSIYFYHFDFYRLERSDEWEGAGFAEYFRADSVAVIEWPERVAARLPEADVAAMLSLAEPGRRIELHAHTAPGETCLDAFAAGL